MHTRIHKDKLDVNIWIYKTMDIHIERFGCDTRALFSTFQRNESAHKFSSLRRLKDLAHEDTDYNWLWALSSHKGAVVQQAQFVEALRLRLECAGPDEVVACRI